MNKRRESVNQYSRTKVPQYSNTPILQYSSVCSAERVISCV